MVDIRDAVEVAGSATEPASAPHSVTFQGGAHPHCNRALEGFDSDGELWHGREATTKVLRRHSADANIAMEGKGGGQGMVFGVIFPTTANILGVLLFLRLPWIVGKAGVLHSFCLVAVCCTCTFITSLSLSAVATNGKIQGGGSYFLISRSLGPALGAGVGLCFYMANSIGAAMYFMGTVEAWEVAFPDCQLLDAGTTNNIRVTGFLILAVAFVVVSLGIKFVTRAGTGFLFIVFFTILCMFFGCIIGPVEGVSTSAVYEVAVQIGDEVTAINATWEGVVGGHVPDNFWPGYQEEQLAFPTDATEYGFIALMALWFPACTGIMAGSNRSADLKDPAGTIPTGTLVAQGSTSICYLVFVLLYGAIAPRETLLNDKFVASSSAFPVKESVIFGVMASTIGAGLTSLVSGCRLLSAIAGDGTLPVLRVFAVSPGKEPRLALLASGVLCCLALAVGELNAVAPILTMFFLMCYTCVNASCTVLELVNDPNWRPTFRFHHWTVSLVGALLCVWMMFAISPMFAFLAIIFCSVIFFYAAHNSHQVKWGDGFQGMKFQLARNILINMDLTQHTKNWRPQLLVVTGASISDQDSQAVDIHDPEILCFASQLKGGRGITIIGGVCSSSGSDFFSNGGPFVSSHFRQNLADGQDEMKKVLQQYQIAGFGRIIYTENFSDGLLSLVQISGLGAFQPNCVLAQWPRDWDSPGDQGRDSRARLLRLVQVAVVFKKVMIIAKGGSFPSLTGRLTGSVDIWWIVADGGILLLLPFLLGKHKVWAHCRMRLFVIADESGEDPNLVHTELETYVRDFRLNIEVHVKTVSADQTGDEASQNLQAAVAELSLAEGESRNIAQVVDAGPVDVSQVDGEFMTWSVSPLASGLNRWRRSVDESEGPTTHMSSGTIQSTGSFRTSGKSDSSQPNLDSVNSMSSLSKFRTTQGSGLGFPRTPPGTIGSSSGQVLQAEWQALDMGSEPGQVRDVQTEKGAFMTTAQLSSDTPCTPQEMAIARGLNALIKESSSNADLVVTNLPDMPPNESGYGYCQLIDVITAGLKRSLLVRGTASEVITEFT